MIVTYDAVAMSVTIDEDDGQPPREYHCPSLKVLWYGEILLFAELSPQGLVLGYEAGEETTSVKLMVEPLDSKRWRLDVLPR